MAFRSSTGDLHLQEEYRRPAERWDREKFDRLSDRDRESIHIRESDRFGPGRGMHEFAFEEQLDRRGGRTFVEEKERFVERGPARSNFDINDLQAASDTANRALAPYRRKSVSEQRDVDVVIRAPASARPQFIRRQSSLDTFDRRSVYRQPHDDGHRAPSNPAISMPIRRRSPSRRRVSPSRSRYREDVYEDVRYQDRNNDIEYRDIHIEKNKSRSRHKSRARSRARSVALSRRSASSSSDRSANFEEISRYHGSKGKPGRTKMPKRLVHKMAVIELGYPFEEEEHFYIVRSALSKEEIDKVVQITETYKDKSGSYRVEHQETTTRHAHHPPPSMYREEYTHEVVAPQSEVVYAHHGSAHSAGAGRHTIIEERLEGDHAGGPLTIVLPEHRHRSSRDIESEIRHLERERREIRYERDVDRYDLEITEKSRDTDRSIVRLDRDRKGRKPANPKLVAAMMATLA